VFSIFFRGISGFCASSAGVAQLHEPKCRGFMGRLVEVDVVGADVGDCRARIDR